MNCFPIGVIGPSVDYCVHKRYIEKKGNYSNIPNPPFMVLAKLFAIIAIFMYIQITVLPFWPLSGFMSEEYRA